VQCSTEVFNSAGAVLTWHDSKQTWDGKSMGSEGAAIGSLAGSSNPVFPLLLTSIQGTYTRQSQEVYPINVLQANVYRKLQFNGAPRGQLQCGAVLSPNMYSLEAFLKAVGKGCGLNNVSFVLKPYKSSVKTGHDGGCDVNFGYQIDGLSLNSFAFNIQGNEVIMINQPLSFTFTQLTLINLPTKTAGNA
jgi:hypothetical protein